MIRMQNPLTAIGCAIAMVLAGALPASAQVDSQYTTLDFQADCMTIAASQEGEGDWADLVCPGFGGYPVVLRYTDGRESATYGFATDSGMATFGPFNYAHDTIEWRIETRGDVVRPFAVIHRWYLSDVDGDPRANQILVVSRVGQPDEGGACAIGYIDGATGPDANIRARELADERAAAFACGSDSPFVDEAISELVGPR
ncbi:hypothetical protein [Pelagibacterium montanilacus]|uniref:hypothetical protein n=1 Tax=Pelagibacterium montanilacus TaxID=2185280 RepID=UPI000F8D6ECE|nr:hypothetical protein [Pelagibacterium montanilacus]